MRIVIAGAGLAGGNGAATLREEGYDGEIVLLGAEPGVPFGRPPLSKTYMRGEEDLSGWLVKPAGWYEDNDVRYHPETAVVGVDVTEASVRLGGGERIAFDRLLIATGCRARRPRIPGIDLDGVYTLRTKADCDAIRHRVESRDTHVLVVGMSFIGAEVAASLRMLGCDVTAVFPGPGPLSSVLGDDVASRMAQIHEEQGVRLVPDSKIASFQGDGRVEAATTESGRRIECTTAVVGLGVEPNVEILRDSGVEIDNGVLVDAQCKTNVDGVYACGDVANHDHPLFGRIRVEHYNNAEKHGRHAARAMLGSHAAYDYVHTFWSDQYDHKIEYAGYAKEWDDFVVRGDLEGAFLGFYLKGGVLLAAMGLDRGGDPEAEPDSELAACVPLIGKRVDASVLRRDDAAPRSALV